MAHTSPPSLPQSFFVSLLLLLLLFSLPPTSSSSSALPFLTKRSSLSVENPSDVLVSPNGTFSSGFFPVGDNAFSFAVWFTKPACRIADCTPVWMANRGNPVNGRGSLLSLLDSGNLVLRDAGAFTVWSSGTSSPDRVVLALEDRGNLVLTNSTGDVLWQSFDSPTDTLLPMQPLTRNTELLSSRSRYNYSGGFYKLHFDNDNVLRILFDGPSISSQFWPYPWLFSNLLDRFLYNSSRVAVLDSYGHFTSSDMFEFYASDYGVVLQRRLTLDFDGNLRLYSRDPSASSPSWSVSWQALSIPCFIHGVCGNNSLCSYDPVKGRSCSCVPGYKRKDPIDWSAGCEPDFQFSDVCGSTDVGFVKVLYIDFYGYDYNNDPISNTTLENCQQKCLEMCGCRGFQYTMASSGPYYDCYRKIELLNGHNLPSFTGEFYIKVPKSMTFTKDQLTKRTQYTCPSPPVVPWDRNYPKKRPSSVLNFMMWFACAVGVIELVLVFLVWFFLLRNQQDVTSINQSYFLAASGLIKRYTYDELKKATKNFSDEIGRGAGGIVYKGVLPDGRLAAIKLLNEATTGEADFLAEASTIGRLNHMNLIEMWGYCAEGKHRLLVYEFMEHGSLAANLNSPELDWKRRFDIAVGTAKGLAYLHEECLEWILHCDVKPQNILLDADYTPKVADFGLSKLMDRGKGLNNSDFSRIRGTRGYMAPEWVSNLPITSKVDVYSYGIVMLELATGMNPATSVVNTGNEGGESDAKHVRLVTWARKKMREAGVGDGRTTTGWSRAVEEMVDPALRGNYDRKKMAIMIEVALRCVEEDKDARPSMSQAVELLLRHEDD
ncbi:hypothetical protein MLD38_034475 [Melastoma candidum]|uniref:Uncharacterized protein n=1 Tax=Melastoma candidum TaxID=119954 RepID=A0ACB9MCK8_9MYRT|nr:hypothetical protein MLD38_034475 [Melastoma candidum]